jgi:hypothetical protein
MTGFPNQGRVKFQDEQEAFNFITGAGSGSTAVFGLGGGSMFRRPAAAVSLAAGTGNQSIFGASKGQFSVEAGKSYRFEGVLVLNTGTTTHTTAFGFVLATAVLANYRAAVIAGDAADDAVGAATIVNLESETPAVINATSVDPETIILVTGSFDCTTAGTVQPVIAFSANPGGTNTVETGSWFSLQALAPSTIEKFGAVT